jgi:C1A family cysteine protease
MKFIVLAAFIACATAAVIITDAQREFAKFKSDFGKVYASADEEAARFKIFQDKLAWVNQHNEEFAKGMWTYTVGINQFSDMTADEFKAQYLGVKFNRTLPRNEVWSTAMAVPNDIDWRTSGAVTPIKDQGQCGSCWAFSTTGSVEGAWQIAGNTLVSLSEQELCDCSRAYGNMGCSGGLMDDAFKYIIANGGIDSETDYPYLARDSTCNTAKQQNKVAHISSFADVPQNNEAQLVAAITKQPISVAIEADQPQFQGYRSGVFSGPCGTNLDHGVLAVGYTDTYFIVKNSWGTSWGDQGYIAMARNVNPPYGICGIAMMSSYPIVASAEN